jgi:hypothetical protein
MHCLQVPTHCGFGTPAITRFDEFRDLSMFSFNGAPVPTSALGAVKPYVKKVIHGHGQSREEWVSAETQYRAVPFPIHLISAG